MGFPEQRFCCYDRARGIAMAGFRSHGPALGRPLRLSRPLIREDFKGARLATPELVEADEIRGRPKAEGPKVHIGFRLAADVVASVRASGPGYNVRVEEALRKAGFGEAAAKKRRAAARKR
jgi:uncharacterized protein (DUF4415 family)